MNPPPAPTGVTSRFPRRPPTRAKKGRRIAVDVNHFKVNVDYHQSDIYQYDVEFVPTSRLPVTAGSTPPALLTVTSVVSTGGSGSWAPTRPFPAALRAQLLKMLLQDQRFLGTVSDFQKNVYSMNKLSAKDDDVIVVDNLQPFGGDGAQRQSRNTFQARVHLVDTKRRYQLKALYDSTTVETPYDLIQALEIAMRFASSLRLQMVGRNLFSLEHARPLGNGIDCLSGAHQSLRVTQQGLTLNLDRAYGAFYPSRMPLVEFAAQVLNLKSRRLANAPLKPRDVAKLNTSLKNVMVEVTHRGGSNQNGRPRYRINGLTKLAANAMTFTNENGQQETVAAFFFRQYNLRVQFDKLPCLHVGGRSRQVYLPFDVCVLVPKQRYLRSLSDRQTAEMVRFACVAPPERKSEINALFASMNFASDPVTRQFGLTVDSKMIRANARVLPEPRLVYANGQGCNPRNGSWRMDPKKMTFLKPQTLQSWGVINFCDEGSRLDRKVQEFCDALIKRMRSAGIRIGTTSRPVVSVRKDLPRGERVERILWQNWQANESRFGNQRPQFLLCVMDLRDASLYGEIKHFGDVEFGMPTQCVLKRHVLANKDAYLSNLVLKIHAKLGGIHHALPAKPLQRMFDEPCAIMGADVSHPSVGDTTRPSIAAVTCSLDCYGFGHTATFRQQTHRVEQIMDLEAMVREMLVRFFKKSHRKPARIVFYRDGVSEGQFEMVLREEVPAIKRAFASLEVSYNPLLTVVVVQKRHHTRLFPVNAADGDPRSKNVVAGTVLDEAICSVTNYDFFMASHAGLQGTSRPCHYTVLYDDNALQVDEIQQLTFHLCYLFARCTRSVSMVPAAYYAHLVAFRARFFLSESSQAHGASGFDLPDLHEWLRENPAVMFFV